jgi:uncharacterized membrane protein YedE/YeeE
MLILHDLPAWHWAFGGAVIALVTLVLVAVSNRRLGISTGFEDLCAFVVRNAYFLRPSRTRGAAWRLPFLAGLVLGGALSAVLGGGLVPTWDLGMFDATFGAGPAVKLAWMFAGGLFIGFGTRMAGGCTSGHGIFGMSNLEASGIVSTVAYMGSGVVTTWLVYRVVL